ncbi:MAG: hypothetical protein NTY38_26830, partial [Acidobacteria bacterium]|nr:hypothetical protein [Acidobacteriota bacterium]
DPDTLTSIDPIDYGEVSGTSGSLTGISIHGNENRTNYAQEEKTRANCEEGGAKNGLEIPTFPTKSVSYTKEMTSRVGILGAEIPTEIPTSAEIPTPSRTGSIDLANFEETDR